MVGYDDDNNALTLGDDDSLSVGDYELEYNSTDDQWQARYGEPIGGDNGFHGKVVGPEYDTDSTVGEHSIRNDGTGYVEAGYLGTYGRNLTGTFSVSYWVKVNTFNGFDGTVGMSDADDTDQRFLSRVNGRGVQSLEFYLTDLDNKNRQEVYTQDNVISQGTWHFCTITKSGPNVADFDIYVDGAPQTVNTQFDDGTLSGSNNFASPINITAYNNDGNQLDGKMDDIRFYDRALSASEVTDLFNGVNVTNGLVARYDFEYPETPDIAIDSTGDAYPTNSISRNTTGSIVPQGLAESVGAGEVLADNGSRYATIQGAIDAATGWVFIGPGTFPENVTISTDGLTLEGAGYDTAIDGGDTGAAINVVASNVTIKDISLSTTQTGSNNDCISIEDTESDVTVDGIVITGSDKDGIHLRGDSHTITNTIISDCGGNAISASAERSIIQNCTIDTVNNAVRILADDIIVANINAYDVSYGIVVDGNDSIVHSNRAYNTTNDGIFLYGDKSDSIIANNRISNIIDNGSTGTVIESNLTGA